MIQLINLSYLSPKFAKKAAKTFPPYFFHGAFAPSFTWCRRPWLLCNEGRKCNTVCVRRPLSSSDLVLLKPSFDEFWWRNINRPSDMACVELQKWTTVNDDTLRNTYTRTQLVNRLTWITLLVCKTVYCCNTQLLTDNKRQQSKTDSLVPSRTCYLR